MRVDFSHFSRTSFFRAVARVLVFLLVSQNFPLPLFEQRGVAHAAGEVLWVDDLGDCNGETPCFTTIQSAIDVATAGQTVRVLAGQYVEQLRITGKNEGVLALESNRITIEADPAANPRDVLLRGPQNQCQRGHAIIFKQSNFVTVRGFRIEGAGKRGIVLRGGAGGGSGIRLERNWLHVSAPGECLGGIDVGRGNPDTVIANNVLSGIKRQALRLRTRSGRVYVVGNTFVRNEGNAIYLSRNAVVSLWNNLIAFNGTRRDGRGGKRFGVRFLLSPKPAADGDADIRNNLICGNARGEIQGSMLGAGDTGNVTPTGSEGAGVAANPDCAIQENVFFDLDGPDQVLDSVDDDFSLANVSPAADAGLDPRLQGSTIAADVFEADYLAPAVRPGGPAFDMGAVEITGPRPTRTATPSPTPTLTASSTRTLTPSATLSPTPSPTATPTATATTTATVTVTPTSTAAAATVTATATLTAPGLTATPTAVRTTTPTVTRTATTTATATPTVTATATPINHVITENDRYEIKLGATLTVPAPGVLGNDVDQLGHPLTSSKLSDPTKGTLTSFAGDGAFTYEAPATYPAAPFQPVVRYQAYPEEFAVGHRVIDVSGDGKPDVILRSNNTGFRAIDGPTGATIWESNAIPAPFSDCKVPFVSPNIAVGDVDDDGIPDIVSPADCARDGNTISDRLIVFNARTGVPKYLSGALSIDTARTSGGWSSTADPTIARLAPDEPPSILVGTTARGNFGDCSAYADGGPGQQTYCRVAVVIDGATGAVRKRMFAVGSTQARFDASSAQYQVNPIVFDLDGDGEVEIVSAGAVFHRDGTVLWDQTNPVFRTAIANLDDTPDVEIVMLLGYENAGGTESIAAFKSNGDVLWSFTLPFTNIYQRFTIADVDRDGLPEILLAFYDYGRQGDSLVVLDREGQVKWITNFPTSGTPRTGSDGRPAVYDLDDDGVPEVIVQTNDRIYFLDGTNGSTKYEYPYVLANYYTGLIPTVADLDVDGHAELVFQRSAGAGAGQVGTGGLFVLKAQNDDWRPVQHGLSNQYAYYGANVEDDGTIPVEQSNVFANARTNVFGTQAPYPYLQTFVGRDETSFLYEATDGTFTSPAQVAIDILPLNRPPVFTSTPPIVYAVNTAVDYQAIAVDPDPADTVTYTLLSAIGDNAGGCSISPAGAFHCNPIPQSFGFVDLRFVILATDGHGGTASQIIRLLPTTGKTIVPNIVGLQQAAAQNAITAASLQVGTVIAYESPYPAGQVLSQSPIAGRDALNNSQVRFTVSLGPPLDPRDVDDDGDTFTENQGDCDDALAARNPGAADAAGNGIDENCDGIDGVLPIASIVVEPVDPLILTGDTQAFTASAILTDGTSADVTSIVVWSSSQPGFATISTTGVARGVAAGTTTIGAERSGITGSTSLTVAARVAGDQVDPSAIITSPADDAEITEPTQVFGTATDANFLRYELAIAPAGETAFTVIASGTSPVTNGLLGTLDPTVLLNDAYELRLTVFDAGGNETTDTVAVTISRNMKIGPFTLAFTDVDVALSGLPIRVLRTYDSRDKRTGDFGVGWDLTLQTLRVRPNRLLGTGWEVVKSGQTFGLVRDDAHKVTVTLPDGKVEEFDLVVAPFQSFLVPLTSLTASYQARPGTVGTLTPLDNNNLLILDAQPGPVELVDDVTFNPYDPQRFRYRDPEGTTIDLDRRLGVERLEERNGNTLTFGPNGIVHSSGSSIAFARDGAGRITSITDPDGKVQTYEYDTKGDLVRHVDRDVAVTRFTYAKGHYLRDMVNPLGVRVLRNDYDANGRLLSTTDGLGRQVTLTHDLLGQLEIVLEADGTERRLGYDDHGNITTEINGAGKLTTRIYDAQDRLISETDPLGHTTSRTWNAQGRQTSATDQLGRTTTYAYGTNGQLTSLTDPLNRTTTFTLDAAGNRLTQTDPAGSTTTFTYDARGNLTTVTDAAGGTTELRYDASGNLTKTINALGHEMTATHDGSGRVTSATTTVTTPTGSRTMTLAIAYDGSGRPTSSTDPDGRVVETEYDGTGNVTKVTDPLGRETTMGYDAVGNRNTITLPGGQVLALSHDAKGRVTSSPDGIGGQVASRYDAAGNLTEIAYPDGTPGNPNDNPKGRVEYDDANRPTAIVDAQGERQELGYDPTGRVTTSVQPGIGTTTSTFDGGGRLERQTDSAGREAQFEFDELDRLIKIIFPDGSQDTREYDAVGNVKRRIDPNGRVTTYQYDALNRVVDIANGAGEHMTYVRDELGRVVVQRDALGRETKYEYDSRGLLTAIERPLGQRETRAYDDAGRTAGVTDFNGNTTTFTYDTAGRLIEKKRSDATTVTFTYNQGDQLATMTDERGVTTFTHDVRGRLTSRTEPDGRAVSYTYDDANRVRSIMTPAGVTSYTLTAAGRPLTVTDPDGGITQYGYDAAGNLSSTTYPNGVVETRGYDVNDFLTDVTATDASSAVVTAFHATYDGSGRRTSVTENGRQVAYGYDTANRLTSETITPTIGVPRTIAYGYDAVGNRSSRTDTLGGATSYVYDANDRLTQETTGVVTSTYTYDDNGSVLTRSRSPLDVTEFTWNLDNRPAEIARTFGATTQTASYDYDGFGTRVGMTVDGAETRYLVDGNRPFAEVLDEYLPGGATTASYTLGDGRISRATVGGRNYYHRDMTESTRALTDGSGNTVGTATFDAYGRRLQQSGVDQPFGFAGEQQDPVTDLTYLRARYLDRDSGRFVSADPFLGRLGEPASLHRYGYAYGDPVNLADPTGLEPSSLAELATSLFIVGGLLALGQLAARAAYRAVDPVTWDGDSYSVTVGVPGASFMRGGLAIGVGLTSLTTTPNPAHRRYTHAWHLILLSSVQTPNLTQKYITGEPAKKGAPLARSPLFNGGTPLDEAGQVFFQVAGLSFFQKLLALGLDVGIGTSTLTSPKTFGGLRGIEPFALMGGFLNGGISVSGGAVFSAIFRTKNNSWGFSFTSQGFGFGTSRPDISATLIPNFGAQVSAGFSIPTPFGFTDKVDPR